MYNILFGQSRYKLIEELGGRRLKIESIPEAI
jgi:hypothetical protein